MKVSNLEKGGGRNRHSGFFHFHRLKRPSSALRAVGNFCRAFLSEEDGQGVIEYILLLSVTVVGAGFLARGILNALDSGILKLGGQLEKDLKTGRAPLSVYQN